MRPYILLILFLLSCNMYAVAQLPPKFIQEVVSDEFDRPVGLTFDAKGNIYVWEKAGRIFIITAEGERLAEPLIDISEEVGDWGDHGLMGVALDPNFQNNGYFYLLYVVDRHYLLHYGTADYDPEKNFYQAATIGRITRYTADPATFTTTLPDSRKVLLGKTKETGFPILMASHGTGTLAFGEDGTLLASCGDGAAYQESDQGSSEFTFFAQAIEDDILRPEDNVGSYRALQVNNLNGKIIRIDPATGAGLSSNPYFDADAPYADASKVWSTGFRNPFRFIVEPGSGSHFPEEGDPGTLIIGDVGSAWWEEINRQETGGASFGWPVYESYVKKWDFMPNAHFNYDAPNPLFDQNNCTQEFFSFEDLIQTPERDTVPLFLNPCNSELLIPHNIPTFLHAGPLLAWSNSLWNEPTRAVVGIFNEEGKMRQVEVQDSFSTVQSTNFDGFSAIPGVFYDGENFPEKYQGELFVADLSGWIKTLHFDENEQLVRIDSFFTIPQKGITDLAVNPADGCIYFIQHYDNELRKICYGGDAKPIVKVETDTYYGPSPLEVQFDASASYAMNGSSLSYQWDFGDGESDTTATPLHTFTAADGQAQSFTVTLTVVDSTGTMADKELLVSVNNTPPEVEISSVQDGGFYPTSGVTFLPLKAKVMDAEHTAEELTYEWQTYFHHNEHYHLEPVDDKPETWVALDPAGCGKETYWYRIRLTVTDAHGLSSVDEAELFPYCEDAFFELADWQAKGEGDGVRLDWRATMQDDISHFEIQRSSGESIYQTVGTVEAEPSGKYSFRDKTAILGKNTYRLKPVRADRVYDYSTERVAFFPPETNLSLFPNPANKVLHVQLERRRSEAIQFALYNASGKVVLETRWSGSEFTQSLQQRVSTATLPNGLYYYRLTDGEVRYEGKVSILR